MPIPWDDEVTASIEVADGRKIITDGPLRMVVPLLAARPAFERSKILLAFPERRQPPFRYSGTEIGLLAVSLEREEAAPGVARRYR